MRRAPGLALQHRQVVTPVVDGLASAMVVALDQALMLTDDLAFGRDNQAIRVDPQAHRPIGIRRWHAVAVALEVDQAGGRDPLGVFHKAIEGPWHRHQGGPLLGPDVRYGTRQLAMRNLAP